jgi:hypothetical protein
MNKTGFFFWLLFIRAAASLQAQAVQPGLEAGLSLAAGPRQAGLAVHGFKLYRPLPRYPLFLGGGIRLSGYMAQDQYFSSAPPSLADSPAASDSLLLPAAAVGALNAAIQITYQVSERFDIGFNIDVAGVTFGGPQSGTHIDGSARQTATALPTRFNLLLIGARDFGTLNSVLYGTWQVNNTTSVRAGYQYFFAEYTTKTPVQQHPEPNDRFRFKSGLLSIAMIKMLP